MEAGKCHGESSHSVSVSREERGGLWENPSSPGNHGSRPPAGFVFGMFTTQQWGQGVRHEQLSNCFANTALPSPYTKSHLEL